MKVCTKCNKEKLFTEFNKNKNASDFLCNECKDCAKKRVYEWRVKKYGIKIFMTKEDKNLKAYKRRKERQKTNPLFKKRCYLATKTSISFRYKKWRKNGSTEKLFGCDFETAKNYLSVKFKEGMTWDNYGKWHIDHIIPLSSAINEVELIKLCNYKNTQPLWAIDNTIKGNKKALT